MNLYYYWYWFALPILALVNGLTFTRNAHIFQLNGYKPKVHTKWLTKHPFFLFIKPKEVKKPLVLTGRVKRLAIAYGLIVLLPVIAVILTRSVPVIITYMIYVAFFPLWPWILMLANIICKPVEIAINNRYIADAKRIILDAKQSGLKVIGVTGSYGKTSVKFFAGKLLSAKFNVLITPESYNTTLGVVRTIREQLKASHEYFIVEMGARNPGDIKEICEIVQPDYGIITAIGEAHLESFGSVENITATKFELIDALDEKDGIAFLNWDNEYIRNRKVILDHIVRFGISNDDADYTARFVKVSERGSSFRIGDVYYATKLLGRHNILNLTSAIAVAVELGISQEELILPMRRIEPVSHRLQLFGGGDRYVIDDAYNSNPDGAAAALETLAGFRSYFKILITPGMVELGEREFSANLNFGRRAALAADYIILIGEEQTKPIRAGLRAEGAGDERVSVFNSLTEGINLANSLDTGGKPRIILFENDLPDNYS